ncbi:M48 family metallopeptidase [Planomonospora venezuelensis]|uniref:STE24 endopeptidase n=1 Tax=Planomonospora venezuelensis TaxID=1999 RepID=A0A841CV72_PLAVE|nr:M48 family metallopeptidase [Planomonospora venezuelensis]MBB5961771.1 STE24 endopeptidase [Planomonospora venezuelensis]GIM98920.1 Ste24 endopeptidase [Planomonospora venezuelensis]
MTSPHGPDASRPRDHDDADPATAGNGATAPGTAAPGLRAAGWALAVLGAATLAITAFTTPWRALPEQAPPVAPDAARDFTAEQLARSAAFDAVVGPPAYLSLGLTLVTAGVLAATPLGARLLGRLKGPWWLRVLLGVLAVTVAVELLRWPLGMWQETHLRDYGLSVQTWPAWAADRVKGIGIRTGLTAVMVLAVVALARRVQRWWLPAALGAFTLTVAASFAYPVLVEPVFNDFRPMAAGQLRDDLLAMAARDGVPVEDVLVADASRRTTALNAYVSGFGATRRIVVYDTLLRAPADEVELVVAHELGHAESGDVLYGTLVGGLGAACGACLLYLVSSARTVRRRSGVPSLADPRAAGLIMGLVSLATGLSGPVQNLVSRQVEARADVHALDLTRDPATFAAMQKRLAISNISDLSPDIVEYVLYASHPSIPERIALARSWAALNGLPEP